MTTLTPSKPVHSRYIVYVDESGDHGPVSAEYPMFVLAFCVFDIGEDLIFHEPDRLATFA